MGENIVEVADGYGDLFGREASVEDVAVGGCLFVWDATSR